MTKIWHQRCFRGAIAVGRSGIIRGNDQDSTTHLGDTRDHADDHPGSVVGCLRLEEGW